MESEQLRFKYTNKHIIHRVCFKSELFDVMIHGFGIYELCEPDIEEFEI